MLRRGVRGEDGRRRFTVSEAFVFGSLAGEYSMYNFVYFVTFDHVSYSPYNMSIYNTAATTV